MARPLELFKQCAPATRAPQSWDQEAVIALIERDSAQLMRRTHSKLAANRISLDTSVVAELDGRLVRLALTYVLPSDPETLFIWKAEVDEGAAETGLGGLMLGHIMQQDACADLTRVQTSIASGDERSWSVFRRFASWRRARMDIQPFDTRALLPPNRHHNDNLATTELAADQVKVA